MRADIPKNLSDLFEIAKGAGFRVYEHVSDQRLSVVSLDEPGPTLRFFAPTLRQLASGTEIGGSLGVALGEQVGGEYVYRDALFHNILNDLQLLHADRSLDDPNSTREFLELIKSRLRDLPPDPETLVSAARSEGTWIAQQMNWSDAAIDRFKSTLRAHLK